MFIWNWLLDVIPFYVHRIFRDRKIYIEDDSVFETTNPRYYVYRMIDYKKKLLGRQPGFRTEIPELTQWCKDNNCIYGWGIEIFEPDFGITNTVTTQYVFIATPNENAYTAIKLRWV